MGDLLGSTGGGLMRVVRDMLVVKGGVGVAVARSMLYVQMSHLVESYMYSYWGHLIRFYEETALYVLQYDGIAEVRLNMSAAEAEAASALSIPL